MIQNFWIFDLDTRRSRGVRFWNRSWIFSSTGGVLPGLSAPRVEWSLGGVVPEQRGPRAEWSLSGVVPKRSRGVEGSRGRGVEGIQVATAQMFKVACFAAILTFTACTGDLVSNGDVSSTTNPSAYITKIFDYQYGPGQHATFISPTEKGADFIGEPWANNKSFTSLGGWGGYLIAGFNHAVVNTNGPDIAIYTQPSVSSEPGVIYVMVDTNNNGLPDDGPWLELKGSEYNNPETIHNYQVTYYKPGPSGYVNWKDNQGKSGSLVPGFATDSWWWPGYGDQTSVTFSGERLPDAYLNTSKDPSVELWMPRTGFFQFGYAECYDNADYNTKLRANFLEISSAVDANGKPANLSSVNFIKVQSGVFQTAGWLNEISTEISGAADIHLLDKKSYE